MTSYELSNHDIKKIAGPKSKIMTYPQVMQHDTLDSMFGTADKVIILYLNDATGNSYQGHWCLVSRYDGKVSFWDPYGLLPDSQLNFNSKAKQKELTQTYNHLTRLLYDSRTPVEYNEMRVQKKTKGINTCGRHVGLRAKYYKIPLKEYQKKLKEMRKNGHNLDDLAVQLTYPIIGK